MHSSIRVVYGALKPSFITDKPNNNVNLLAHKVGL